MGLSLWELRESHPSFLNAYITIHKEWCQTNDNRLFSMTYLDGRAKLNLHKLIHDWGEQVPCAYPILDPKFLSKFERWKKEVPKFHPTFKYRIRYTYKELMSSSYKAFSKKDQTHGFIPLLKDFTNNSQTYQTMNP